MRAGLGTSACFRRTARPLHAPPPGQRRSPLCAQHATCNDMQHATTYNVDHTQVIPRAALPPTLHARNDNSSRAGRANRRIYSVCSPLIACMHRDPPCGCERAHCFSGGTLAASVPLKTSTSTVTWRCSRVRRCVQCNMQHVHIRQHPSYHISLGG